MQITFNKNPKKTSNKTIKLDAFSMDYSLDDKEYFHETNDFIYF